MSALLCGSKPDQKPDLHLGFEFSDAKIRYTKTMPLLENGSGNASILRQRFAMSADAGYVQADQGGRVDIAGTSFIVPDITVKEAHLPRCVCALAAL